MWRGGDCQEVTVSGDSTVKCKAWHVLELCLPNCFSFCFNYMYVLVDIF